MWLFLHSHCAAASHQQQGQGLVCQCHLTPLSFDQDTCLSDEYGFGGEHVVVCTGVRAKVLSVDAEKQRLSLGLKPSYFSDDDVEGQGPDQAGEEEKGTPSDEDDDLDAEVLEAMEGSSDEEDDWRAGAKILDGASIVSSIIYEGKAVPYECKGFLNGCHSIAGCGTSRKELPNPPLTY